MQQKELARAFTAGTDSTGSASNMAVQRADDGDDDGAEAHLVAYGWAVYATRYESGRLDYYGPGWAEWSREKGGNTTQCQLSRVRRGMREALGGVSIDNHALVTVVDGERPTVAAPPDYVDLVGSGQRDRGRPTARGRRY